MDGESILEAPAAITNAFLFRPASWVLNIELIQHLILTSNVFCTVFAPVGGGKTSFSRLLDVSLSPVLSINSLDAVNATGLLDPETGVENIVVYANEINQKKKHTLLVIDNAEHIPTRILEVLLAEVKRYEPVNFFHVCLVSAPSLHEKLYELAEEHKLHNPIHTLELEPWSPREMKTYLLKKYFSMKQIQLTDTAVNAFHQLTGGFIADINREVHSFFQVKAPPSDTASIKTERYVLGVCCLITLLAVSYIWKNQAYLSFILPLSFSEHRFESRIASVHDGLIVQQYVSYVPTYQQLASRATLQPAPLNQIVAISYDEEDEQLALMGMIDSVVAAPKILNHSIRSIERYEYANKTLPSTLMANESAVVAELPTNEKLKNNKPLFTIQLVAMQQARDIKRCREKYNMMKEIHIHRTVRAGVSWYVLTLGEYTNRADAQKALSSLPSVLAKNNPWVRPINELATVSLKHYG